MEVPQEHNHLALQESDGLRVRLALALVAAMVDDDRRERVAVEVLLELHNEDQDVPHTNKYRTSKQETNIHSTLEDKSQSSAASA